MGTLHGVSHARKCQGLKGSEAAQNLEVIADLLVREALDILTSRNIFEPDADTAYAHQRYFVGRSGRVRITFFPSVIQLRIIVSSGATLCFNHASGYADFRLATCDGGTVLLRGVSVLRIFSFVHDVS